MTTNKKPRKAYKPKVVAGGHLPIMTKVADAAETSAWMALQGLKQGFYNKRMGLDLVMFLNECRNIIDEDVEKLRILAVMYAALNAIADRHKKTGKWGASGDELRRLTTNMPAMIEVYRGATRTQALKAEQAANRKLEEVLREKSRPTSPAD